jgi:hypothetical protein
MSPQVGPQTNATRRAFSQVGALSGAINSFSESTTNSVLIGIARKRHADPERAGCTRSPHSPSISAC